MIIPGLEYKPYYTLAELRRTFKMSWTTARAVFRRTLVDGYDKPRVTRGEVERVFEMQKKESE